MLKTAIGCRNKNKNDCFVLKIAIGCRNKSKKGCFVLFRLESATYSGEIPKEGEGNTKRRGIPKVKEANGGAQGYVGRRERGPKEARAETSGGA